MTITLPTTRLLEKANIKLPHGQKRRLNQHLMQRHANYLEYMRSATQICRDKARALQIGRIFSSELQKAFRSPARVHRFSLGLLAVSDLGLFDLSWNCRRKIYSYCLNNIQYLDHLLWEQWDIFARGDHATFVTEVNVFWTSDDMVRVTIKTSTFSGNTAKKLYLPVTLAPKRGT